MNFIKRAFLSVKSRIGKTFLQLFIFTAICVLVISGLAIQTATTKAADIARQSLGGKVTLSMNMEMMMAKMLPSVDDSSSETSQRMERPTLEPVSVADAEELASYSQVLAYNLLNSAMASASSFTAFEFDEEEMESDMPQGGNIVFNMDGEDVNSGDISLQGVLFTDSASDFYDATSSLVEGRHITDEDKGSNVVVINDVLAEDNGLSVGDTITIAYNEVEYEAEIVGIYETEVSAESIMMPMTAMLPYNKIYVPYTMVNEMTGVEDDTVASAEYHVSDPALINDFIFKAESESGIDFDTYKLDANDLQYEQMTSTINNVASFSTGIIYIVSIGGSVILGLMVMLTIRERKNEIGVLLAIGESKGKVIGQFVTEGLMVAVVALGLSIAGGNAVASVMSDQLLDNAIESTEGMPGSFGSGPQVVMGGVQGGGFSMSRAGGVETITDLDVSVTGQDIAILGIIGLGIVIVSTAVPCLSILRLQPKTILTRQD